MYGSDQASRELRQEQELRAQKLGDANQYIQTAFQGFDPQFYKQREQAYLQYANPILNQEYQKTRKDLTYNLANRGLLGSQAAGSLAGSLQREMNSRRQQVADQAINEANAMRGKVEESRGTLLSQAQAGLEPSLAKSQAISAASQFTAPNPFQPVGGLLNNWSNMYLAKTLVDAYQQENAKQQDIINNAYNPKSSPVRTVGQ